MNIWISALFICSKDCDDRTAYLVPLYNVDTDCQHARPNNDMPAHGRRANTGGTRHPERPSIWLAGLQKILGLKKNQDCHPKRSEGSPAIDAPCVFRRRSLAALGMTIQFPQMAGRYFASTFTRSAAALRSAGAWGALAGGASDGKADSAS